MPKTELEINWIHLFSVVLQILWGTRADLFSKLFAYECLFYECYEKFHWAAGGSLLGTHCSFQSVILKLPAHPFPSYRNTQTQILNKSYMHQFGVFYNVNTMTGPKQHMLTMGSRFFFFPSDWFNAKRNGQRWEREKESGWEGKRKNEKVQGPWVRWLPSEGNSVLQLVWRATSGLEGIF